MTWKTVVNADTGTADKFGGDDIDKISQLFSGTDVDDIDVNSDWKFRSSKLSIANPANTFSYLFVGSAIGANRSLTIPLLTGADTLAVLSLAQTMSNKTLDATCVVDSAAITIANDLITYAKMQNVSAASKLLGRGDSGSGDPQEITLGTGLSMSGTTLSSTANTANVAKTSADSPYTILSTDSVIRASGTTGNLTLNLPTASGIAGTTYTIVRTDIIASTNLVTIDASGTETIDGLLTWRLLPGEKLQVQSDGTNWITLYHDNPSEQGYHYLKGATANRRYPAMKTFASAACIASTTAPAANTLWALPFWVSKVTQFDTISFEITTAQASQNCNAGIYFDSGNAYPGALIFNTGSISTATTGVKNTTITSSLQIFQPGLYWLAWETSSTTAQVRVYSTGGTQVNAFAGFASTIGTTPNGYAYSVADTYGATLPDPYPSSATLLTTAPSATNPVIALFMRAI